MGTVPVFASADEALDMVRAGLGYLAAADATQLGAAAQARCLKVFEQADAIAELADPPDTRHGGRCRRAYRVGQTDPYPPRVLAALAAGQVSASVGRQICLWTDKLPGDRWGYLRYVPARRGSGRAGAGGARRDGRADVRAVPIRAAR